VGRKFLLPIQGIWRAYFPDNRTLFFPDGRCWNLDGSTPPNRVTPDVIVPFYQRVFDRGRDLTMESAIYWLKQQQK
jgi:hypothetical protein